MKRRGRQSFRRDVGELQRCRNMQDTELAERDLLSHKMNVELDMLRAPMINWIRSHVDGGDVVAVDHRAPVEVDVELAQQLAEPAALCDDVGDAPVLRLYTGAGHSGLALRRPGDKRIAKEHRVTRCRTARVRAPGLVRVGVGDEVQLGGAAKM